MKVIRLNQVKSSSGGKTAAFFDVQTPDGIILKGFRIVNGSNGLFISSPDEKGKDGKYYETVILPKEMKNTLQKAALEELKKTQK
ncbi:MAG: septation protein SpoVG family protein [Ignavibacteria bacterium]|jgi:stage V sporulation protein G